MAEGAAALQPGGGSEAAVVDRLFRTYDSLTPELLTGRGPVLLVSVFGPQAVRLRSWLEELGAVGVILEDYHLPAISRAVRNYCVVCVVLDESFLGAGATRALIRQIRDLSGDLPVVVLSPEAGLCRFEPDQAWPADVVLRLPVSRTAIKLGIVSAISNREIACHRGAAGAARRRPAPSGRLCGWVRQRTGNALRALIGGGRL